MNWLVLYAAIAFEIGGTTALKLSDGMTRLSMFSISLGLYAVSFALLAIALRDLPVGVVYAIWSGVGTAAVAVIGMVWFGESAAIGRLAFIAMIVIGAVGLNVITDSTA